MADERDEQATQVGHQVVEEGTEVFYSRDQAQEQAGGSVPPTPPAPSDQPSAGTSPAEADRIASDEEDPFAKNPIPYVAGAFVGALVFAQILKRITNDD